MATTVKERSKKNPAPTQADDPENSAYDHKPKRLTEPNERILWLSSAARDYSERVEMLFYALALTAGDKLAKDLQEHFQTRWAVDVTSDVNPGAGNF